MFLIKLFFRYEESIERNIELESKGDDAQRKIAALEAQLRRTKDRLTDNQVGNLEKKFFIFEEFKKTYKTYAK